MPKELNKFVGENLNSCHSLGWFGLAADPPSLAHRSMIDAVMGSGLVEKIIVFPAGKLDYKDFEASDWQRMEMLELWKQEAEFGDEIVLSKFDILSNKAIKWIDLWFKVNNLSPKIKHYLVLGADQYLEIPRSWDRGEDLLMAANLIIVPRQGYRIQDTPSNHFLLKVDNLKGSSTEVRRGNLNLVDKKVKEYIMEHKLYS